MADISAALKQKLVQMLVENIGTKVKDGITYVLLFDTGNDTDKIKEYQALQKEAEECGIAKEAVVRSYKLKNGFVFDMDLGLAKQLSASLVQAIAQKENLQVNSYDQVGNGPEKRREEDIEGLIKFLVKKHKEGKKSIDVALFSRNKVDKIEFTAKDKKTDKDVKVTYPAFAIRHWDMQRVAEILATKHNIKIANVAAGEVLPSKTGVRFQISLV